MLILHYIICFKHHGSILQFWNYSNITPVSTFTCIPILLTLYITLDTPLFGQVHFESPPLSPMVYMAGIYDMAY